MMIVATVSFTKLNQLIFCFAQDNQNLKTDWFNVFYTVFSVIHYIHAWGFYGRNL